MNEWTELISRAYGGKGSERGGPSRNDLISRAYGGKENGWRQKRGEIIDKPRIRRERITPARRFAVIVDKPRIRRERLFYIRRRYTRVDKPRIRRERSFDAPTT